LTARYGVTEWYPSGMALTLFGMDVLQWKRVGNALLPGPAYARPGAGASRRARCRAAQMG
jgi:hypothetical protein